MKFGKKGDKTHFHTAIALHTHATKKISLVRTHIVQLQLDIKYWKGKKYIQIWWLWKQEILHAKKEE